MKIKKREDENENLNLNLNFLKIIFNKKILKIVWRIFRSEFRSERKLLQKCKVGKISIQVFLLVFVFFLLILKIFWDYSYAC